MVINVPEKRRPIRDLWINLFLKVLVGVALVLFLIALAGCGRGGKEEEGAQQTGQQAASSGEASGAATTAGGAGGTTTGAAPSTGAGMGQGTMSPGAMGQGGTTGAMGQGGTTGAGPGGQGQPQVQVAMLPPLVPNRPDPFQSLEPPPPKPKPPKPLPPLPQPPPVPPGVIVIRPAAEPPPPPPPPPPAAPTTPAQTRMAGVLWGDDVLGILVHQGKGYVVRPGEIIDIATGNQPGEYMVVSITMDSLFIRLAKDPTAPLIRVPLQSTGGTRTTPTTPGGETKEQEGPEKGEEKLPGMI